MSSFVSILHVAMIAVSSSLLLPNLALAKDSARIVCAGNAEYGPVGAKNKIGILIDFFDSRSGVSDRKWVLSSIHQQKLFQGSMIDKSGNFASGRITLSSGAAKFYVGQFKLENTANDRYAMTLDGEINDNPASGSVLLPLKTRLPCMDISG